MTLLLELFKGTGSAGKNVKKLGWDVLSVDIEEEYKPDIVEDILKLDYKKLPTPDYLWASPPCNTFSLMSLTRDKVMKHPQRQRNSETMRPLNARARLGDRILNKTIEIIRYFKRKNPKLRWVMENPHGAMWKSPLIKKLPPNHREKTYYCLYKDKRTKPTDFWSNVKLNLKDGSCRGTKLVAYTPPGCGRYRIPQPLLTDIFNQLRKTNAPMV